jgi:hypothetical protein
MAEYQVEQLARDAKVFQIYAGTDEILAELDESVQRTVPSARVCVPSPSGR